MPVTSRVSLRALARIIVALVVYTPISSTAVQARERISDARRFNRETIMPPYLSSADLHNVAPNYRGRAILTPQALEDIVSYLLQTTLTEP